MLRVKPLPRTSLIWLTIIKASGSTRSISAECVTAMTKELMGVVSRYDLMDFPFMVAALRLTATSLESLLDEHGKGIADNIVANTTCITIDASELKRQAKEEE